MLSRSIRHFTRSLPKAAADAPGAKGEALVTQVPKPTDVFPADVASGVPPEISSRSISVRIYRPANTPTQSGSARPNPWRIDFDSQERGDPVQALSMKFLTKEDAILFAERQGYNYWIDMPKEAVFKPKMYAENFKVVDFIDFPSDDLSATMIVSVVDIKRLTQKLDGSVMEDKIRQMLKDDREERLKLSRARVKNWDNTIAGQRRKKLEAKGDRLAAEEAERMVQDRLHAEEEAERRRLAIERAKQLQYNNEDSVRAFHSRVLLFQVLKERDLQVQTKKAAREMERLAESDYVKNATNAFGGDANAEARALLESRRRLRGVAGHQIRQMEERMNKEQEVKLLEIEEAKELRRVDSAHKREHQAKLEERKAKGRLLREQLLQMRADLKARQEEQKRQEQEESVRVEAWVGRKRLQNRMKKDIQADWFSEGMKARMRLGEQQAKVSFELDAKAEEQIRRAIELKDLRAKQEEAEKEEKKRRAGTELKAYFAQNDREVEERRIARQQADALELEEYKREWDLNIQEQKAKRALKLKEGKDLQDFHFSEMERLARGKRQEREERLKDDKKNDGSMEREERELLEYMRAVAREGWARDDHRLQRYVAEAPKVPKRPRPQAPEYNTHNRLGFVPVKLGVDVAVKPVALNNHINSDLLTQIAMADTLHFAKYTSTLEERVALSNQLTVKEARATEQKRTILELQHTVALLRGLCFAFNLLPEDVPALPVLSEYSPPWTNDAGFPTVAAAASREPDNELRKYPAQDLQLSDYHPASSSANFDDGLAAPSERLASNAVVAVDGDNGNDDDEDEDDKGPQFNRYERKWDSEETMTVWRDVLSSNWGGDIDSKVGHFVRKWLRKRGAGAKRIKSKVNPQNPAAFGVPHVMIEPLVRAVKAKFGEGWRSPSTQPATAAKLFSVPKPTFIPTKPNMVPKATNDPKPKTRAATGGNGLTKVKLVSNGTGGKLKKTSVRTERGSAEALERAERMKARERRNTLNAANGDASADDESAGDCGAKSPDRSDGRGPAAKEADDKTPDIEDAQVEEVDNGSDAISPPLEARRFLVPDQRSPQRIAGAAGSDDGGYDFGAAPLGFEKDATNESVPAYNDAVMMLARESPVKESTLEPLSETSFLAMIDEGELSLERPISGVRESAVDAMEVDSGGGNDATGGANVREGKLFTVSGVNGLIDEGTLIGPSTETRTGTEMPSSEAIGTNLTGSRGTSKFIITPSGLRLTRYNLLLIKLQRNYHLLPEAVRISLKKDVKRFLQREMGDLYEDCVIQGDAGKKNQTYGVPETIRAKFMTWAREELSNRFPSKTLTVEER
ncbi:hypothetical protein HK101_010790 [Irineochytrium annulatum]|nr:hypothetical protein HK101_010790 [Irineochytrium annulatum]